MVVTGMPNLAVKVVDLDEAVAFYERAGFEVRDRIVWRDRERADVCSPSCAVRSNRRAGTPR
ncbi:MAG: hypothetical protein ACRDWD_09380 [Acidimicrobiia bacterium]